MQIRQTVRVMTWTGGVLLSTLVSMAAGQQPDDSHGSKPSALPRVPDGFTIEKVAGSPLVKHPMMAGFDDRGRLYVAASSGKNLRAGDLLKDPPNFVQRLEDTDGDGRFDKSTVFADKMTLPMGALWHQGALYVASPPSIWRLQDTDGDGIADRRDEIVNTFGFSGNAASVHGCFLGPNGRIYWCDGRHGHEFVDAQGRTVSQGKAARIFSCRPDGSDVQTFCGGGMDNPVEIDFTAEGEMLGSVNILLSKPRVDCLMHWIEGGVYPREDQQDCIAEFRRTGDLLPPMSRLGHVAVSGMTRYRSDHFGPEYQGNLFTTIFNTHKVVRSIPRRTGATFETVEEDFLVSHDPDFHPTDVLEDADGSLLVIDTGGWFRIGCPTSKVAKPDVHGAIYRIRREGRSPVDDPRGLQLDLAGQSADEVSLLLGDPRPEVQQRAIETLARAGDSAIPALEEVLHRRSNGGSESGGQPGVPYEVECRNAVWALSRIGTPESTTVLMHALTDPSESVRLAAARSLGTLRSSRAVELLCDCFEDETAAVRRTAATALGRICESRQSAQSVAATDRQTAVETLLESMHVATSDRFLEHAVIFAVIRIADRELTRPYLSHANPKVRRTALIALDQMEGGRLTRQMVTPLLDTDDAELQQTALSVIAKHDGWAGQTLQLLRTWIGEATLPEERVSVLRGFLLAQAADPEIQGLVADALGRDDLNLDVRMLLLEVVHRAPLDAMPPSWVARLRDALHSSEPQVRGRAVRIVHDRNLTQFDERLKEIAGESSQPADLRVEALLAAAERMSSLEADDFEFLQSRFGDGVSPLDRLSAARALADAPLSDRQLLQLADRLRDAGPLSVPVLLRAFGRSDNDRVGQSLITALEDSSAVANVSPDELARLLRNYSPDVRSAASDLLRDLGVDVQAQQARLQKLTDLLEGGNAEKGRAVFFGKRAACASCHAVNGRGATLGPDLTRIAAIRTDRDLLEAVVLPSASFARGYRPYSVVTKRGRVHSGIIVRQTAESVSLRTAELAEIRIPRDEIEAMTESNVSIMPQGLDKTLNTNELRDLMAFLKTCR